MADLSPRERFERDLKRGEEGVREWNDWITKKLEEFAQENPNSIGIELWMEKMACRTCESWFENLDREGGGFKLRGVRIPYANLEDAELRDSDFTGADLRGANLVSAKLKKTELRDSILEGADLTGANLTGANLTSANLKAANLTGAYLTGANLTSANLKAATLFNADLARADLSKGNFEKADMRGAKLGEATLIEANLQEADLTSADLDSVNSRRVNLTNAKMGQASLRGATLSGAILAGAYLNGADLSQADLSSASLTGATLQKARLVSAILAKAALEGADLGMANLMNADLSEANLVGAKLQKARLGSARLRAAKLSKADLGAANLGSADLCGASLEGADLSGADLTRATLVNVDLTSAKLNNATIYGTSVWDVKLDECEQDSMVVTPPNEPELSVDDLVVAQFMYTILDNANIRRVLDSSTTKGVLILGRFTDLAFLRELKGKLRKAGYLPMLFDFRKPENKTLIDTVETMAKMCRFIIGDFTNPKIILQEFATVLKSTRVPFLPIIHRDYYDENVKNSKAWTDGISGYDPGLPSALGDYPEQRNLVKVIIYDERAHFLEDLMRIIEEFIIPIEENLRLGPLGLRHNIDGYCVNLELDNAKEPVEITWVNLTTGSIQRGEIERTLCAGDFHVTVRDSRSGGHPITNSFSIP